MPTDILYSWESEDRVLGFLLNGYVNKEDKEKAILVLYNELFSNPKFLKIFAYIKLWKLYDKIVLFDKLKANRENIDWIDVREIDDATTKDEFDSYVRILEDKAQKRKFYETIESAKAELLEGKSQFDLALEVMDKVSRISDSYKLRSNMEILDSTLDEDEGMLVKTGYEVLDFYTGGFTKGNVITIGGDSGHLKTTIAIDMAFRMLDEDPKLRIGIFSKEMLTEELMRKIICRQCKLSMKEVLSRQYSKADVRKIIAEYEPIASGRLSLVDPYNFSGVSDIAKIQFVHKFDVWFLDFIQLLEFGGGNSSSDVNVSIMQNMKQLKNLSVNTKTLGIVLSQIKKGVELRRTKIPTVNDLEWSGTIKQLSSYVLISYFPIKYYKNQVIPGVGTLPKDLYYLLGEKTRFADDLVLPMKVHAEYGLFEEYLDLSQRVQKTNILSFL